MHPGSPTTDSNSFAGGWHDHGRSQAVGGLVCIATVVTLLSRCDV